MKIVDYIAYEGRNIYSHKKCIRVDLNLEGFQDIPSREISNFNDNLVSILPELKEHRCGIDVEGGFLIRLKEGTYLAHIYEHIIIAIHNKLELDISYGKAREIEGANYYVVFQYIYKKVAIEIMKLGVDLINGLINSIPINFDERIDIISKILIEEKIGPTTEAICMASSEYGLPFFELEGSQFYQIGYGKQGRVIEAAISPATSCVSVDISCNKMLTNKLLKIQNIPTATSYKVFNIINLLECAEKVGYPVVLKPQFGSKGRGVYVNLKNEKDLVKAYSIVKNQFEDIIIEKFYDGNDYRVCIVNNKVVAVSKRIPPCIKGDGKSNIYELIESINNEPLRGQDHEKPLTKISIDKEIISYLNGNGYNLNSIIKLGEIVYLRENSNISTGGVSIDCTDYICDENKKLCIRAAQTLGLDICGIDLCCKDISKSIEGNGIVMEINAAPGLRMHYYPMEGKIRNVGKEIVNMMYNDNPTNIPVISITGTNGKTTTTRIINHVYSKMGYITGMTSTEGIFINDECIDRGDDTGFESAKAILLNKQVEVAVLETARGGIIKKGLAYDLADVSVITNITEDHLGNKNINTMEELVYVKSLVAEAVKEDGYVVINADDYWSSKVIPRIKSKIIYFSIDYNNDKIQEQISNKGIAVYIKNNYIFAFNEDKEYLICSVEEVPITLEGKLEFNIENVLAATAALVGQQVDYCMIKRGLMTYKLNSIKNSGRFNIHSVNGVDIILDYGHNIEGYKSIYKALKKFEFKKVIGVIGIPGDRSDSMAEKIALESVKNLDYIIIKEDKDSRGRDEGEISILLHKTIQNSNGKSEVILDEVKALERALTLAQPGDAIVVFYEELEPLVKLISSKQQGFKKEEIV